VQSLILSVAERMDVVVDFRPFAGRTLYLENRMEQLDGRGPTGRVAAAGAGATLMQLRVSDRPAEDGSADPATLKLYDLPARPPSRR
jgi:hypothetical protein